MRQSQLFHAHDLLTKTVREALLGGTALGWEANRATSYREKGGAVALFLTPLDDPYGYDAYRLLRSKVVPAGLATVVLGCALGSFAVLLPPLKNEDAHAIATELSDFWAWCRAGRCR